MVIKCKIVAIFGFFVTSVLSAGESYDFYSCPSIESGKVCSEKCEKIGNISFDVRRVLKDGNVNVTLFTENEVAPETLKNCEIQNANNWFCETIEVFQEQSHSMSAGLYFGKKIFRMLDGEDDVSVYCARERVLSLQ
ncbi:hypothetical protein N9V13_05675 [Betaproteobacteria bacterium]|nr:hypothetical protein [Betaproteobacteria bacterium]